MLRVSKTLHLSLRQHQGQSQDRQNTYLTPFRNIPKFGTGHITR